MDDREIVAAIVAADLAGLAAAYDEHAQSLYGYCRWMLSEPEDAADAVEETFVIAAARLGGLRDPRKLRPWLYAVARNECHGRLRASEVGLGESADPPDPPDPPSGGRGAAERAQLRRLVRTALDGLSPGEREVSELDLRHGLQGADLAAVIGVPRNQAHTLASHARSELEKAVGALFVARTGRRACAELDLLLDGWDGQLDAPTRKQVSRHIEECDACADRSHGALAAAVRYGMAPLAEPRPGCARRSWTCAPIPARMRCRCGGRWHSGPERSCPMASRRRSGRPGGGCSRCPGSRRRRASWSRSWRPGSSRCSRSPGRMPRSRPPRGRAARRVPRARRRARMPEPPA